MAPSIPGLLEAALVAPSVQIHAAVEPALAWGQLGAEHQRWGGPNGGVGWRSSLSLGANADGSVRLDEIEVAETWVQARSRPALGELMRVAAPGRWRQVWWSTGGPRTRLRLESPLELDLVGLVLDDASRSTKVRWTNAVGAGIGWDLAVAPSDKLALVHSVGAEWVSRFTVRADTGGPIWHEAGVEGTLGLAFGARRIWSVRTRGRDDWTLFSPNAPLESIHTRTVELQLQVALSPEVRRPPGWSGELQAAEAYTDGCGKFDISFVAKGADTPVGLYAGDQALFIWRVSGRQRVSDTVSIPPGVDVGLRLASDQKDNRWTWTFPIDRQATVASTPLPPQAEGAPGTLRLVTTSPCASSQDLTLVLDLAAVDGGRWQWQGVVGENSVVEVPLDGPLLWPLSGTWSLEEGGVVIRTAGLDDSPRP